MAASLRERVVQPCRSRRGACRNRKWGWWRVRVAGRQHERDGDIWSSFRLPLCVPFWRKAPPYRGNLCAITTSSVTIPCNVSQASGLANSENVPWRSQHASRSRSGFNWRWHTMMVPVIARCQQVF